MQESSTVLSLLLRVLKQVPVQAIFDQDPYESRRTALKGSKLLWVLVAFQLLKTRFLRGLVKATEEHQPLQQAIEGPVARNTLSNALAHQSVEQRVEAWMLVLHTYGAWVERRGLRPRRGKKFARIALIDASLIKLSLAAYAWAEYRKQSGAAKMHAVLEWARGIPEQLVLTPGPEVGERGMRPIGGARWSGKRGGPTCRIGVTSAFAGWQRCWPLASGPEGAHFVVRPSRVGDLKHGIQWTILARREVPVGPQPGGIRLTSDWTVRLAGWPEVLLRIVSYQLPDGRLVRVLTDRFDLSALSIARLYKERWKIENWRSPEGWRWIKAMLKIKEPLGESQNALQIQIGAAFVTDLLWRAFKTFGGFRGTPYEFVTRCQELSLVRITDLVDGVFRRALEAILKRLNHFHLRPQPT